MNNVDVSQLSDEQLEQMLIARKKAKTAEKNAKRDMYEKLKNETVHSLVKEALQYESMLKVFKTKAFDDMSTLHDILKEYSDRHADGRGNFSVISEDGENKIEYKRQDQGFFDERSAEAEKHIIDFITKEYAQDQGTKELIMQLLERKKGKLDIKLVQKLYSMEDKFEDPNWKKGIQLLKESWQSSDTKSYINFYHKDSNGEFKHIGLSFSSI